MWYVPYLIITINLIKYFFIVNTIIMKRIEIVPISSAITSPGLFSIGTMTCKGTWSTQTQGTNAWQTFKLEILAKFWERSEGTRTPDSVAFGRVVANEKPWTSLEKGQCQSRRLSNKTYRGQWLANNYLNTWDSRNLIVEQGHAIIEQTPIDQDVDETNLDGLSGRAFTHLTIPKFLSFQKRLCRNWAG